MMRAAILAVLFFLLSFAIANAAMTLQARSYAHACNVETGEGC